MTCRSIRSCQKYGLAIVVVSMAAASVVCVRAQAQLKVNSTDRPLSVPTADNWLVLAQAHSPGVFDAAAATVSRWGADGIMASVQLVTHKSTDVTALARA